MALSIIVLAVVLPGAFERRITRTSDHSLVSLVCCQTIQCSKCRHPPPPPPHTHTHAHAHAHTHTHTYKHTHTHAHVHTHTHTRTNTHTHAHTHTHTRTNTHTHAHTHTHTHSQVTRYLLAALNTFCSAVAPDARYSCRDVKCFVKLMLKSSLVIDCTLVPFTAVY